MSPLLSSGPIAQMRRWPIEPGHRISHRITELFRLSRLNQEGLPEHFFPRQELTNGRVILFSLPVDAQISSIASKVSQFQELNTTLFCLQICDRNQMEGSYPLIPIPDIQGSLAASLGILESDKKCERAALVIIDGTVRDVQIESVSVCSITHPDKIYHRYKELLFKIKLYSLEQMVHPVLYEFYCDLREQIYGSITHDLRYVTNYSYEELPKLPELVQKLTIEIEHLQREKRRLQREIQEFLASKKELIPERDKKRVSFELRSRPSIWDKHQWLTQNGDLF